MVIHKSTAYTLLTSHHYLVHAPHSTRMSCSQWFMQFASQFWCFEGSANSEPFLLLVHPTAKHVCLINSQSSGTLRHLRESLTAMFSNSSEPVLPKSWCFVDGECACCVVFVQSVPTQTMWSHADSVYRIFPNFLAEQKADPNRQLGIFGSIFC